MFTDKAPLLIMAWSNIDTMLLSIEQAALFSTIISKVTLN